MGRLLKYKVCEFRDSGEQRPAPLLLIQDPEDNEFCGAERVSELRLHRPASRFGRVDADGLMSVDLLEEIRATLDGLEALLVGRVVDIEMSRLRVLTDPKRFRRVFGELIESAVARSQPTESITVRVARTGKTARIEVLNEDGRVAVHDHPDLASAAEEARAMGGEIGTAGAGDAVTSWMTVPLAAGSSSAADT